MKRRKTEKNILADYGIKCSGHSYWWAGLTSTGRLFLLERNTDYNNKFNLKIDGIRPSVRVTLQTAINKINSL